MQERRRDPPAEGATGIADATQALDFDSTAFQRARQAVIDIGSNSVRLVIYDGPRRAPFPICNEKALCGLGRDMSPDGELNPDSVASALETLARFRRLLAEHGDPPTMTVATAAVREAKDGSEFVAQIRALGMDVDVIDGREEATLSATGVASFEPGASGLVGDMGGGSLELIAVQDGEPTEATSLSIGPLRLMQLTKGDLKQVARIVDRSLKDISWLRSTETLYAVGGAWRAIARLHMQHKNHPLPVLHHYELSGKQAIEACDLIARQSRASLEGTPGISSKRVDAMPYAAIVLRTLIEKVKIKTISVSAGGLREGLLYRALSPADQRVDPLLAGAAFLSSRMAPEPSMGAAYAGFIAGAFADDEAPQKRIRIATSLLADIGAYFHPDLRGEHAFDTALRAPFYAVTHPERALIALSLYCRHEGPKTPASSEPVIGLLTGPEQKRATQIGLALRFGASIAPKAPHAIRQCSLRRDERRLLFTAPRDLKELVDDTARKRFDALAEALGLAPSIEISD